MKKYYHATFHKNVPDIMQEGIKAGWDGVIYLAETPQEAAAFLIIRNATYRQISVIEVELPENDPLLTESFDHSKELLPITAWMYDAELIPPERIKNALRFCDSEEMDYSVPQYSMD